MSIGHGACAEVGTAAGKAIGIALRSPMDADPHSGIRFARVAPTPAHQRILCTCVPFRGFLWPANHLAAIWNRLNRFLFYLEKEK